MSWIDENYPNHEGYEAHIARDGRSATGTRRDGLVMDHTDEPDLLPWTELLGWEARCECGWTGPMYRATTGADEQDACEHPVEGYESAEDAIHDAWRQHLDRMITGV